MPISPPTLDELYEFMPTATVVLLIFGLGYSLAWWSRSAEIKALREWLEDLRRK